MSEAAQEIVHEVTSNGRERHYMVWDGEKFVCECGDTRDRYGHAV